MVDESADRSEFYQLAEDFLRLQFRLLNAGLKLLPRATRPHAVAALRESFEAARATRQHFAAVIEEGLEDLTQRASAEPSAPRKVNVVRETASQG